MTRTITRRIVTAVAATAVIPACIALSTVAGAGNAFAGGAPKPPNVELAATYMPQTQYLPQTIYTPQVRAL